MALYSSFHLPGRLPLQQAYQGQLLTTDTAYWLPGLASGVVAGLVGPSGVGKTWLALLLAHDWALDPSKSGRLTGLPIAHYGRVAFLALEAGRELPRRLQAIGRRMPPSWHERAADGLWIFDWSVEETVSWPERVGQLEALLQHDIDCLIIDNLRRLHPYDENRSDAMARVLGDLQRLAARFRSTILTLHHTPWGAEGDAPVRGRGSSAISNTWRWIGGVRRGPDGVVTLRVEVSHEDVPPGAELGRWVFDPECQLLRPVTEPRLVWAASRKEDRND